MVPFFSKVGERAFKEMGTLIVVEGESPPAGPYGFLEFYCDEIDCDCRRVLLQVIRPDTVGKVWATINFGWEKPEYYRAWSHDAGMASRWRPRLLSRLLLRRSTRLSSSSCSRTTCSRTLRTLRV
jgi:hypothetical protein